MNGSRQVQPDTVLGIFPDGRSARQVVSRLVQLGLSGDAIRVWPFEDDARPITTPQQGLLTGAAIGGPGAAALEATVLSFPPAAVFIAGGTLAAALAGLSVGAAAGAAASALIRTGTPRSPAPAASTPVGRSTAVCVSVSAPRDMRERARLLMRVNGAFETHDPDDDSSEIHFASGFVNVVPELKRDLQQREGDTRRWTQVEPFYRYGWQMANRPDFAERTWGDAVQDIEHDWGRRHARVPWTMAARFVERGWLAAQATRSQKGRT